MITPRETRLLRAPHLRAFQRALARLVGELDPAARRLCAVIVPTRAAADELRRTLEQLWLAESAPGPTPPALVFPDLVTRQEWYRDLHARLRAAGPLLTDLERGVLFQRAARAATEAGCAPPFEVRPGLVEAILEFYDALRRRQQSTDTFERLTIDSLNRDLETDRGAARMLDETRFFVAAFRAYERLLDESDLLDEHGLRERLLGGGVPSPPAHVILTVADDVVDHRGFWPADFDLLTRLPGLRRIDVVTTEEMLATGFHERLHRLLPDIVETRLPADDARMPVLVVPPAGENRLHWISRDREEELADAARRAKALARANGATALDRTAVVFQRPLPYVYLARQVFGASGVPYQTLDALPLAAEPYAAALDLVFAAVIAGFTRATVVALLRSPHFRFASSGRDVTFEDTAALDAILQERRFLGGRDRLIELTDALETGNGASAPRPGTGATLAARALVEATASLAVLDGDAAPSLQLAALAEFLRRVEVLPAPDAPWRERHLRARAAILGALDALAAAHARYDDAPRGFVDLAATIRRWIETQTFSPRAGRGGVHLVDAAAARYGSFDDVRLVGFVDTDWPEAVARTVFYPGSLLAQLQWPADDERRRAPRCLVHDLLRLASERISVSTVTLEDDALVRPSPFLEDLADAGLAVVHETAPSSRIFTHEALADDPLTPEAVRGSAGAWLALRRTRTPPDTAAFHGSTGPRRPEAYRVSSIERYLQCPFKYFADRVLRLEEERDEEPGLTPQERGLLLHEVLQEFFAEWQAAGGGALTAANWADAAATFARIAEARLARLPEVDRALERARLLGSAVATGIAERAFAFEIGSETGVVERLLEHALEGEFGIASGDRSRPVRLRGKADRIDLLADHTLRVIDYKLGRPPKAEQAIQLPVYGVCAEQRLAGYRGVTWRFAQAGYVAFGGDRSFAPFASTRKDFDEEVQLGQARLIEAVDGIERGEFPVRPAEPYRCQFCAYPTVCRKDYVGDE